MEEPPDEISKGWRPFELEFPESHIRVPGVHEVLACSTGVAAVGVKLDIIEDVLYVQPCRLVMDNPVDTFVEDNKKAGLKLVRNPVDFSRVEELLG